MHIPQKNPICFAFSNCSPTQNKPPTISCTVCLQTNMKSSIIILAVFCVIFSISICNAADCQLTGDCPCFGKRYCGPHSKCCEQPNGDGYSCYSAPIGKTPKCPKVDCKLSGDCPCYTVGTFKRFCNGPRSRCCKDTTGGAGGYSCFSWPIGGKSQCPAA